MIIDEEVVSIFEFFVVTLLRVNEGFAEVSDEQWLE